MLAKALSGGMIPIGAILYNDKCYNEYYAYKHSSTFAGNNLACKVGFKTLELLEKDEFSIVRHVKETGQYMKENLLKIQEKFPHLIKEVR